MEITPGARKVTLFTLCILQPGTMESEAAPFHACRFSISVGRAIFQKLETGRHMQEVRITPLHFAFTG
jgi:hypothetical protein